jgi:pimeloyl-ACP methyl ester carboxylesterase
MKRVLIIWAGLAIVISLTGCAHLSRLSSRTEKELPPLARASNWVTAAGREKNAMLASEKSLTALRLALAESTQDSLQARDVANLALARFIMLNFKEGKLGATSFKASDGLDYRVHIKSVQGDWQPGLIDRLDPIFPGGAQKPTPLVWKGWGVPMIGVSHPDRKSEPFAPRQGYRLPVTVAAEMRSRGGRCDTTIRLLHPGMEKSLLLAGMERPVAGNLEAPTAATFRLGNPFLRALQWLFAVDRFAYPTNLIFIQPYDPNKIPVVLVHGLLSTQAMWGEVVRGVESDPLLRKNYQFWCFLYPNGQPIPLSALELRRDLRAAETRYRPRRGLILVGHSMGGIISRAQVSSSGGHAIVNEVFGHDAPGVLARLPNAPLLHDSLIFDRDKNVRRVVFICVPHQGSAIASAWPVRWITRLIRLPNTIVSSLSEVSDIVTATNLRRAPTSICGLSPRSQFLLALNRRPIEAPHHSIIGDRGRGDSPNSSDGVVPYRSAHLPTAESELIVPCGHGAVAHPATIAELKRILHQELNSSIFN